MLLGSCRQRLKRFIAGGRVAVVSAVNGGVMASPAYMLHCVVFSHAFCYVQVVSIFHLSGATPAVPEGLWPSWRRWSICSLDGSKKKLEERLYGWIVRLSVLGFQLYGVIPTKQFRCSVIVGCA